MTQIFQRTLTLLLLFSCINAYAGKPVFQIIPVHKAPATIYAGQTATASYRVVNNTPFTLTNNALFDMPAGLTQAITPGSCGNPFSLPPRGSCILNLLITANNLQGNLIAGPIICNNITNPIHCSRPAAIDELHVIKSNSPPPQHLANLTVTPTNLTFTVNSNSSTIQVRNTSTTVTASGIVFTPSPNLSIVNTTCNATLAPQATCTFQLTSSVVSTANTVSIQGANTNAVTVVAEVSSIPQANLTLNPATLNFITGGTAQTVTLTNLSTVTAENLQIVIPGTSSVTVDVVNTTCTTTLAANTSCVYSLLPGGTTEMNTLISITGTNSNTVSVTVNVTTAPLATINVSPATLSFAAGGPAQTVTVSNPSGVNTNNLQATIPGTSSITIDVVNTTCTATLASGATCVYSFLPGNATETNTVISIAGTNSNTVTVTADVNEILVTLSPDPLNFEVGASGTVTVTNQSTTAPINNLQVSIPTSNLTVDTGASSCTLGGSVAPSGSCTLVFNASTQVSGATVTVQGDNTDAPTVTINAALPPATTLNITAPTIPQIVDVDGSVQAGFITVENTGTENAINVTATSPWTGVTLTPDSDCANLAPTDSCTLSLSAALPNLAGQITVQAENAAGVTTPYVAFRYQGGLVFAISGSSPAGNAKVVNESDLLPAVDWGGDGTSTGAASLTDGQANTTTIVGALPPGTFAASVCNDLSLATYSDWYLPAICEYGITGSGGSDAGCGTSTPNVYSNLYQHGFGGFNGFYWSSTETTVAPSGFSWLQHLDPADHSQFQHPKGNAYPIRCVRQASF